ncbi:hypothetical protein Sme01_22220 [Sphaerisporangium melleum]|uniref:Cyanobacterial TRADD-N associated 2 transmembrane domain-containing protein n=1 Tax=Sphaerisporangium melleum TaxID=321316 RepID=A0A917VGV7_9ACTN|nr:hypothetical protein [Sphaerisporangium melleum]GGK79109.1 hypothetical protein GCM10007964_22150 [Sphaerisporangium melleum]GII69746.1 hypothetical protein Sme01_22220 [Sphaerisporangium melleum]
MESVDPGASQEQPPEESEVQFFGSGRIYQQVFGNQVNYENVWVGPPLQGSAKSKPDLAELRQEFLFDFLRQALRQAETTFRLSVIFMSAGAAILLAGGGLALYNAGVVGRSYVPLLTGLSGVLITACGGAFAVHSNRARKHLTDQAKRVHENIQDDLAFSQALDLINEVKDVELRDRLKSVTAMRVLGVRPDPGEITNRVLPWHEKAKEAEPGNS